MEIVCPKCKETIKSDKAYFCYFCGSKLPSPVESNSFKNSFIVRTLPKRGKGGGSVYVFGILFFLVLAIGGGLFYYMNYINKPNTIVENPVIVTQPKEVTVDIANFTSKLSAGEFKYKILASHVPIGIDMYAEFSDPKIFWDEKIESVSDVNVTELLNLTTEEAASFLDKNFVVIYRGSSWAFIDSIKNKDFVEEKVNAISKPDFKYNVSIEDDFLVVSNDINLNREVASVFKETSLSLGMDSFFLESVKNLPKEGDSLVFFRNKEAVSNFFNLVKLSENVTLPSGKNAFVLKKNGTGSLLVF